MTGVLIVVPQLNELQPLIEGFSRLGHASRPVQLGTIEAFLIPSLELVVAVGGHGKTQFGIQAQYLIERIERPRFLFCVGAGGCLTEDLKLGDVVVGTETIEHDYKIRFAKVPTPTHLPDATLLKQIQAAAASTDFHFDVHFGPIASGDEDIVELRRKQELKGETNALCVAWEGSGGARAAHFNGIGFAEIRCITDGADAEASSSFHQNCMKALPNAAELIVRWRTMSAAV